MADAAEPNARGGRRALAAAGAGPCRRNAAARGGVQPRRTRRHRHTASTHGACGAAGGPAAAARAGRFGSPEMMAQFELQRKKIQFLADQEVAVLIEPSNQGDGGTFFVQSASIPGASPFGGGGGGGRAQAHASPSTRKTPPRSRRRSSLSKEHYNRLVRMCEAGEKVKMAVELKVQFHDEDLMSYNTVAEIPGTDLKHELVMLGGHMDSWHSGTGATDNGAGVSVGMEAVRILKALDLKPRRTIRIALWSGEEQGLMGSRAFVREHFGRSPASMFGAARRPTRRPQPQRQRQRQWIDQGRVRIDQGGLRELLGLLQPR